MEVPAYIQAVADWLERSEPQGWATVRSDAATATTGDDASGLLRAAYRLEPAGHPTVHAALARAVENLRIDGPVAVYQLENTDTGNAGLLELPDELAVLLSGNLVSVLPEDGLCAVFGHELAHAVLHRLDDGRYRVAERLLGLLSVDAATPPAYLETARRLALATELFCDRGSVVACGGHLHPAVAALVSVATGLADVDPVGYLAQAEAADPRSGSRRSSHPETALRAWALSHWFDDRYGDDADSPSAPGDAGDRPPAGDEAARALLRPGLDLDQLDVFDRADLELLTRGLISGWLLAPEWRTEAVVAHAHAFFPDLAVDEGTASEWGSPVVDALPEELTASSRRYLAYVLLDLVAADPEVDREQAVAAARRYAERLGLAEAFADAARAELQLSAAAWSRVEALQETPAG